MGVGELLSSSRADPDGARWHGTFDPVPPERISVDESDLADELQRRSEGLVALFPLGRADLARVVADVLSGLDLADELGGVAADALSGDLGELDDAVRVDQEGAAVGETLVLTEDLEVGADLQGRVTDHGVLDLADGLRRSVPRLVREVRVGRDGEDLDAELLQLLVVVREVAELRRADEREVCGVEEEDRPLALDVLVGHGHEGAVLESLGLEGLDLLVDQRHVETSLVSMGLTASTLSADY